MEAGAERERSGEHCSCREGSHPGVVPHITITDPGRWRQEDGQELDGSLFCNSEFQGSQSHVERLSQKGVGRLQSAIKYRTIKTGGHERKSGPLSKW